MTTAFRQTRRPRLLLCEEFEQRLCLNGTGFFDMSQKLGHTTSLALGDLDGDDDLDLVSFFTVFLNNGHGVFHDTDQTIGDLRTADVALGDLDGDGDLDAFVANGGEVPYTNLIWINDGNARFVSSPQRFRFAHTYDVELGDIDGDGDLDAVLAKGPSFGEVDDAGDPNNVLFNDGHGRFTDSGQTIGAEMGSHSIALADVDGDGGSGQPCRQQFGTKRTVAE